MNHLSRTAAFILLVLFQVISAFGQRFTTTLADTKAFPEVATEFIARTPSEGGYQAIGASDLRITEYIQGVPYQISADDINISCAVEDDSTAVSVLLIIDVSKSMGLEISEDGGSKSRMAYLKTVIEQFVERIDFETGNQIAVLTFGSHSSVLVPWTSNGQEVKDSLQSIIYQGATRYLNPINGITAPSEPNAVSMFSRSKEGSRRVVIFLTDGRPSDESTINMKEPNNDYTNGEKAINDMKANNITFNTLTIFSETHVFLAQMSQATGGKDYQIENAEKINDVYDVLAEDVQNKEVCTVSWHSPFSQTEEDRFRRTTIEFVPSKIISTINFDAGQNSIAGIEEYPNNPHCFPQPAKDVLYIGFPDPGRATLSIYTIDGRLLLTEPLELNHPPYPIPVSFLRGGIYLVQITYDEGQQIRQLVTIGED